MYIEFRLAGRLDARHLPARYGLSGSVSMIQGSESVSCMDMTQNAIGDDLHALASW